MMKSLSEIPETNSASASQEVPFSHDEIFFSKTNEKGHILSGNSVFQRISLYSWEELINKPHNIIRHQDMPRAVFWLLWETIKQGEAIGAYVKNKAKDGRYYWVFAIVTPIECGYLSVRIKPSSPLFSVVEEEYISLSEMERSRRPKPAESGKLLLARLAELGFQDYQSFMATALAHEMRARNEHLGRAPDNTIIFFDELSAAAQSLLKQANIIFDAYAENAHVPLNLRVQAAQLGDAGATIGVISNNYNLISADIKLRMDEFMTSADEVFKAVNKGMFLACTAKIQKEIVDFSHEEAARGEGLHEEELASLDKQRQTFEASAIDSLHTIEERAKRFHQSCTEMNRLAAGLEVTRIMGKVESSRLSVSKGGLNDLIDNLEDFQKSIAESLKEINRANQRIQRNIQHLLGNAEAAA